MSSGRLRFFPPTNAKKDRDEELALFRELFKREREKSTNLLEAVSTEFEHIDGNSVVYKISSGKKADTPGSETEKNDYDWLKTPPATPLFQSLEMDVGQANNANMVVHKELPIIAPLKASRFSEKTDSKTSLKPPSSPSLSSFLSSSSSRPETPDPYSLSPPKRLTTPITTPRFGGTPRFLRESNKETPVKPLQPGRFLRKKEETKLRPQSPGAQSVASSSASSRPGTPETNPKPPSIRRAALRAKEDPKPVERSIKGLSKEGTIKQMPDKKPQSRQFKSEMSKPRPASPSARSVASASSSRPETPASEPIKSKVAPKTLDKPVKKIIKEVPAKKNPESIPNGRTISPTNRSRFPATLPDFPTEAPPNLITSVASGRNTSATRSRPGSSAFASTEQRRTPSVTKGREPSTMEEMKGNEKKSGSNNGVVIGSSMVEKMMNARRSTATGKVIAREDKTFKMRGGLGQASK